MPAPPSWDRGWGWGWERSGGPAGRTSSAMRKTWTRGLLVGGGGGVGRESSTPAASTALSLGNTGPGRADHPRRTPLPPHPAGQRAPTHRSPTGLRRQPHARGGSPQRAERAPPNPGRLTHRSGGFPDGGHGGGKRGRHVIAAHTPAPLTARFGRKTDSRRPATAQGRASAEYRPAPPGARSGACAPMRRRAALRPRSEGPVSIPRRVTMPGFSFRPIGCQREATGADLLVPHGPGVATPGKVLRPRPAAWSLEPGFIFRSWGPVVKRIISKASRIQPQILLCFLKPGYTRL